MQRDEILATIARHVPAKTGKWQDQEVAVLVAAVSRRHWSTDAQVSWRKRQAELLAAATDAERTWEADLGPDM